MLHLKLNENKYGVDYVVGDIHGEYDKLFKKLHQVGFDFNKDRLIAVGDLVDRGPESYKVVDMLNNDFFFSVLGNHEQMTLEAYKYSWTRATHIENGGAWFFNLTRQEQDEVAWLLEGLPLSIRFEVDGRKYLIVHSTVPRDDPALLLSIRSMDESYAQYTIWDRMFFRMGGTPGDYNWECSALEVPGYDKVFVGHTPVASMPVSYRNYINMDTGVCFYKDREFWLYNTKLQQAV